MLALPALDEAAVDKTVGDEGEVRRVAVQLRRELLHGRRLRIRVDGPQRLRGREGEAKRFEFPLSSLVGALRGFVDGTKRPFQRIHIQYLTPRKYFSNRSVVL